MKFYVRTLSALFVIFSASYSVAHDLPESSSGNVKVDSLDPQNAEYLKKFCPYHPTSSLCYFTPDPPVTKPFTAPSTQSSGTFPAGGTAGEPASAPSCSGAKYGLVWHDPLVASDMGKSCQAYFNAGGASKWHLYAFSGSKGSRAGMMNGMERCQLGAAPDGRPSIKNLAPKGEVQNWQIRSNILYGKNVTAARVDVDIWIPNDMRWGHDQKLAFGLWGGGGSCIGGGCPPSQQTGFAVRDTHSPMYGARLYSYALNRGDLGKKTSNGSVAGSSSLFGLSGHATTGKIPTGRWVTLSIEVIMNDLGKANGVTKIYMDNVLKDTQTGLVFRDAAHNWTLTGLLANDMWGGTEEDPIRWSPSNQAYWYSNFRIYAGACK